MSPLGSRGPYSTREPSKAHCIQHCNCKTMNPAYTISSASRRCFVVAETPLLPILVSLGAHGEAPTSLSLSPETEDWQKLVASLSRKTYSHARSSSSKGLGTVPPSVVTTTEIPSTKTIRETIKRIYKILGLCLESQKHIAHRVEVIEGAPAAADRVIYDLAPRKTALHAYTRVSPNLNITPHDPHDADIEPHWHL